jgi:signal transduction histidine kinase
VDEARRRELRLLSLEQELREANAGLERRVQERTEELRRTIRDLESFAAMASHDLRAPLHSMEGFAKALEEDHGPLLPPQAREWLGRIRTSAARLGGLIDSLLRLARTGQAVVARREVDLSALASEIVDELVAQEPARETGISIESGVCSLCDPTLARAVMENLLGNAWKYSSRKDKTVIRFGRDSSGWLYVADKGAGFDMAKSDGLFQSFQRLHRADEFEGAGIGLATVRRILEHHEGAIRAQAEPGVGAAFHFHFGDLRMAALD